MRKQNSVSQTRLRTTGAKAQICLCDLLLLLLVSHSFSKIRNPLIASVPLMITTWLKQIILCWNSIQDQLMFALFLLTTTISFQQPSKIGSPCEREPRSRSKNKRCADALQRLSRPFLRQSRSNNRKVP